MKITTLASGSTGNCYIIEHEYSALIIECGVKLIDVKKALNFQLQNIVGCLISHSHLDHCKYVKDFAKSGINIYCSEKTKKEFSCAPFGIKTFQSGVKFKISPWTVYPFKLHHSVENHGFIICDKANETLLFATDTSYISENFVGLNYILIEANYCDKIIQENIEFSKQSHAHFMHSFSGHMSIDTCCKWLSNQDLRQCKEIRLIHLSNGNSNEIEFKSRIEKEFGIPCVL